MRFTFRSIMESSISHGASGDLAPVYIKANSLLRIILVLLFLATLAMAPINGRWASSTLIGSLALLVPLLAMRITPTALITRLLVAASLMVFAALQIHLLSGLIEAHFLIFILLSILLAYRDWRTIVGGAAVIAVHHLVFSYLQHSGFAVYVMSHSHVESSYLPMVLVHATYVVVQTAGLCILARQMERDAVSAEELGRLSSHIGRREGVFDLGTLQRVAGSIEKVSGTSQSIAQGTGEISERSREQEDLLRGAISTLDSVSTMVHNASVQAEEANGLAESAGQVAAQGKQLVDELSDEMSGVQESSTEISNIISMIDSIASQTNILALNASVEAARAGESGRGFAVVASEVRTLAQKTAAASHDIRELIGASQAKVVASATKTGEVATAINDVLEQTHKVALIMSDISTASRDQRVSITEVSEAISHVGDSTQDNAKLVESASGAAEDLRQQAEELSRAVQVFELGPSDVRDREVAGGRAELETVRAVKPLASIVDVVEPMSAAGPQYSLP